MALPNNHVNALEVYCEGGDKGMHISAQVLQGRTAVNSSRRPFGKVGSVDRIPGAVVDPPLEWGGPEAGRKLELQPSKSPPGILDVPPHTTDHISHTGYINTGRLGREFVF